MRSPTVNEISHKFALCCRYDVKRVHVIYTGTEGWERCTDNNLKGALSGLFPNIELYTYHQHRYSYVESVARKNICNSDIVIFLCPETTNGRCVGKGAYTEWEYCDLNNIPIIMLYQRKSDGEYHLYSFSFYDTNGNDWQSYCAVDFGPCLSKTAASINVAVKDACHDAMTAWNVSPNDIPVSKRDIVNEKSESPRVFKGVHLAWRIYNAV